MDAERRFEPWPFALAAALLTMMAIAVAFYAVAAANPDALVVDDAYAAGLAWNAGVRERERAEALGVELGLAVAPAEGGVAVHVTLAGAGGAPVSAERVTVRRERPAEGGLDADFELVPAGSGWRTELPLPRPGRWRLAVTAWVEGLPVRRAFRVDAG